MSTSHILVLPAQELAALQAAAQTPQFAHLLNQLPAFKVALDNPLPDALHWVADGAVAAAQKAKENTNYPEDWDDLIAAARELRSGHKKLCALQDAALAGYTPPAQGAKACPCCGGTRFASSYSKACSNWFEVPHLEFKADYTYMPCGMGVPGDGDGPSLEVCLDCGRIQNDTYPLPDDVLQARVAEYNAERDYE